MTSRAVLITGCSSGIGRATAARLAEDGWTVYATARNVASIEDLGGRGCKLLALDVTDRESMKAAVETVEAEQGAVGVLINNAAYGLHGAIETTDMDAARTHFETNFFGLATLIQLVLPAMRKQGWGKIVNVSSMGGKLTLPGGGFYHASKHAVESLSDALRFEVSPFGVDVILIEPGIVKTAFGSTAVDTMDEGVDSGDPYAEFNRKVSRRINGAYGDGPLSTAASPESVAKIIEKAISAARPKTRYQVTPTARAFLLLRRFAPDRLFDYIAARSYGLR